jgi:hypothetical protein
MTADNHTFISNHDDHLVAYWYRDRSLCALYRNSARYYFFCFDQPSQIELQLPADICSQHVR